MFRKAIINLPQKCGFLKSIHPAATTIAVRHGHRLRGKPVGVAKSIEERIQCKRYSIEVMLKTIKKIGKLILFVAENEKVQQFVEEKKMVDIGFPAHRLSRAEETKLKMNYRQKIKENPNIERQSRKLECKSKQSLKFKSFKICMH